jgi:hypothetical protein
VRDDMTSLAHAFEKCLKFGLHPADHPLDDGHHTDVPFTKEDKELGDALSYFLGTLFADVDGDPKYWYCKRTAIDEWCRVARALRIHGLAIKDK